MIDLNQRPPKGAKLKLKLWHGDTPVSELTIQIKELRPVDGKAPLVATITRRMDHYRMSEAGRKALTHQGVHDGYECWNESNGYGRLTYGNMLEHLQQRIGIAWEEWSVASQLGNVLKAYLVLIEGDELERPVINWHYDQVYVPPQPSKVVYEQPLRAAS